MYGDIEEAQRSSLHEATKFTDKNRLDHDSKEATDIDTNKYERNLYFGRHI